MTAKADEKLLQEFSQQEIDATREEISRLFGCSRWTPGDKEVRAMVEFLREEKEPAA